MRTPLPTTLLLTSTQNACTIATHERNGVPTKHPNYQYRMTANMFSR